MQLQLIRADSNKKWNFNKANWDMYSQIIDRTIQRIPAIPTNYDRFVNLITAAAKKSIPRGHREAYIPGWSTESKELYKEFKDTGNIEAGTQLLRKLDDNRRKKWEEKTESLSFAKSSRKAWNTLNRLNGKSNRSKKIYPVNSKQIATKMMENSKGRMPDKQKKMIEKIFNRNFRTSHRSSHIAVPFSSDEVFAAVKQLQCGKAPGYDCIFPDNLTHLGFGAIKWLTKFFSNIFESGKLRKEWKRAKVVAVLKPNKSAENPANYRPISLLSCCLKLFERCLLGRIHPIIENVIQKEQARFQKGRSCCDQVLALTNYLELGFEKNMKTGVVFLDLSAAYDTVWKRGLLMKLSEVIPCLDSRSVRLA